MCSRLLILFLLILAPVGVMASDVPPATSEKPTAKNSDPAYLVIGAGSYDFHRTSRMAEASLSYRSDYEMWIFKPHAGALITGEIASYAWAGLLVDIDLSPKWVLTPSTAFGVYSHGRGKNLGSSLGFRTGIDIAYRFEDHARLGLGVYHLSNAGIGVNNPGEEGILINYALPITKLFK